MGIPKVQAKALGHAVKTRREALDLSQEELSERAGVHRAYVGLLERGQTNATLDYLVRVAKALDTSLGDLFKDAGV